MARIFIDGFEGDLSFWSSSNCSIAAAPNGMSGNACKLGGWSAPSATRAVPAKSEYYLAFKFQIGAGTGGRILQILYNGTLLAYLAVESYVVRARRANGAQLGDDGPTVAANVPILYEFHYKADPTAGIFTVKVGGAAAIDFQAGNTSDNGTMINQFMVGPGSAMLNAGDSYCDDFIVDDANWIGNSKVQAVLVNGAGGFAQFTPLAGANYENIDEVPVNEADYNETAIADKVDTFSHPTLTGAIGSIKTVQVQAAAILIGNPTPANLKLAVVAGGTLYFSSNQALTLATKVVHGLWETNPNTGAAWTPAEVNAAEIGYKSA